MAYGDVFYAILQAGSTATSAATAHNLFGTYNGLSAINQRAVVHLQIAASVYDAQIGGSNATNNTGYKLFAQASMVDWPPMRAADASQLKLLNSITGSNTSVLWVLWERNPSN